MNNKSLKIKISFFIFILFVISCLDKSNSLNAKIIMQTYLQNAQSESVTVMVETDKIQEVSVSVSETSLQNKNAKITKFSSNKYIATDAKPASYVYRVELKNLKNAVKYFYSASQDNSNSKESSFKLSGMPSKSFRFASYGDSRSAPKLFAKISNGMAKHNPDISIYLGDLSYDGSYDLWKKEFFIDEQLNFASQVPFFNAVGNHEGWKQNTKAFTTGSNNSTDSDAYYSFDYGDVHFLILSTEQNVSVGSDQWKFAEEDLKKSNKKWKIVAFHIPAYGAGAHNENKKMIEMSKQIFDKYNVDIVLTGHSHFYQHNKVNNIHHFVLGGGGSPLYEPKTADYTIKSAKVYHYAIFDVAAPSKNGEYLITMNVFDIDGNLIDTIKFEKK